MRSNNPVFSRSPEFNQANAYGNQTYSGAGQSYPGYGQQPYSDPSTWGTGTPGAPTRVAEPMTIDSVVQKSGLALAIVFLSAAATWFFTGGLEDPENAATLYGALLLGSGAAFVLSLVNSFKRSVSPALVIAFCLAEGVALGALSKFFNTMYPGVVVQAILGTFAAFAGTLAAYKFFDIQVGDKFRKGVIAAMFGMVGLGLVEMMLGFFGGGIGLFGDGGIGLVFAVAGLVLGVFMLLLDFDFVEQGVAAGIPERESWRAAFALTVSLVWIYTNLLRLLAIFNQD